MGVSKGTSQSISQSIHQMMMHDGCCEAGANEHTVPAAANGPAQRLLPSWQGCGWRVLEGKEAEQVQVGLCETPSLNHPRALEVDRVAVRHTEFDRSSRAFSRLWLGAWCNRHMKRKRWISESETSASANTASQPRAHIYTRIDRRTDRMPQPTCRPTDRCRSGRLRWTDRLMASPTHKHNQHTGQPKHTGLDITRPLLACLRAACSPRSSSSSSSPPA